MNNFLQVNKNLIAYSLILMIVIPIFGINFFLSLIGNILLLLFLIPLLIVLILFVLFKSYKSKINTCSYCGALSFGNSCTCMNCGADLEENIKRNQFKDQPSESTIDVQAEEIS